MIRNLLVAAGAIVALNGMATAADILPKAVAAPAFRPGCANFGGFYAGGHVGSTIHDWDWQDRNAWARNEVDLALPGAVSGQKSGISGGAQAGWNWQRRCTVFGLEADWTWAGLSHEVQSTDGQPGAALDRLNVRSKLDWYGTLRTRAGVVVDDLLIYATGGFIYGSIERSYTTTNILAAGPLVETFVDNKVRWGWTAGIGTEWQWTANWSIKGEALYARFQDQDVTHSSAQAVLNGSPATKNFTNSDSLWIARLGVNYRF